MSESQFRRGRWWRTGACGTCGADPALVTWVGAVRDESRPTTHRHVIVCDACVGPYDQPEPESEPESEPEPEPEPVPLLPPLSPPTPLMPRRERWLHIANTALSVFSVIFAVAAFCIAQG